ncbi:MAG: AAA family ATPase [Bacteroidia bacterium]|nr:AAA family ATPase [Bacteroidia bacterium]
MESLRIKYLQKRAQTRTETVRDFIRRIDWRDRFIGIKGMRGAGKTTLALQYAALHLPADQSLYASLDDLYFRRNGLYSLCAQFVQEGGVWLLLDEVHRYAGWSQELKLAYDDFPGLRVLFTGSSMIHLADSSGDLSRRAVVYELPGLSFREYLQFSLGYQHPVLSWEELLRDHQPIAVEICRHLKPLAHFGTYLRSGYLPFFLENPDTYLHKLAETVNLVLETDFPALYGTSYPTVDKLKTLLAVIAERVPFKPNIQKLSEQTGLARNSLVEHLHHLEDAGLLRLLHRDASGITRLQKPEKIYLANPNLAFALHPARPDTGSLRESFFLSQMPPGLQVRYTESGDFRAGAYTFEVGGAGKGFRQLQGAEHGYVAADQLEIGAGRKIPLWMFGLLS